MAFNVYFMYFNMKFVNLNSGRRYLESRYPFKSSSIYSGFSEVKCCLISMACRAKKAARITSIGTAYNTVVEFMFYLQVGVDNTVQLWEKILDYVVWFTVMYIAHFASQNYFSIIQKWNQRLKLWYLKSNNTTNQKL